MNATFLLGILGQVMANPIVTTALTVLAGVLVVAWLLAVAWAFRQMADRTDSVLARYLAATWVFLSTPLMVPISVAVVALVRPHEVAGERRISRLLETVRARAEESPACASCGRAMDERWVRCPDCAAWTGRQCGRCQRWAPPDTEICPWCAWAPGDAEDQLPPVLAPRLEPRPERAPVPLPTLRDGVAAMADAVQAAPRSA
jgi:RNA polymerase subunit RPABC4/transcription elongation factor Spt4